MGIMDRRLSKQLPRPNPRAETGNRSHDSPRQGLRFDLTFSSRLASPPREPELRSRWTRFSRVCRTTSTGVRGFDLKRPFILAPSSAAAAAAAADAVRRGGEGKGEALGRLRPADPNEKQPRRSATRSPRARAPEAPCSPPRGIGGNADRSAASKGARTSEGMGLELAPVMRAARCGGVGWGRVIR